LADRSAIRLGRALPVAFYARDPIRVARDLLGRIIRSDVDGKRTAGKIVEVEAYTGVDDPASHCWGGRRTDRTEVMFGPPGRVYVYFSYGMHWCMNAVAETEGTASAVLIRALEPVLGLETMRGRRGVTSERNLCSGPAKLCQALGVTGGLNGDRLFKGDLQILEGPPFNGKVVAGPRVGISRAIDWPLRFAVEGSEWISRPAV
jgi:DNA-3-methyladenine glycosylase